MTRGLPRRIRIYAIGSTNTTNDPLSRDFIYAGMADKWPNLWWIENGVLPRFTHDTFRGCYLGGEQDGEWGNRAFIERNIRGRGTSHDGEFPAVLGDAFPVATWPEGTLKEGDTPSFLYLLSPVVSGVGDVNDPTQESWGGQFHRPAGRDSPTTTPISMRPPRSVRRPSIAGESRTSAIGEPMGASTTRLRNQAETWATTFSPLIKARLTPKPLLSIPPAAWWRAGGQPTAISYPQPGWVEQDTLEIWRGTLRGHRAMPGRQ